MIPGIAPAIRKKTGGGAGFSCTVTTAADPEFGVGYSRAWFNYGTISNEPFPNNDLVMFLYYDTSEYLQVWIEGEIATELNGDGIELWVDGMKYPSNNGWFIQPFNANIPRTPQTRLELWPGYGDTVPVIELGESYFIEFKA